MCCCLWQAGIFGEQVVDLELKLVGLMVQSLDQEHRPSDTRREVFGVGQEVGQSRSQVGIDLSAGIQLHGHVEVFHLCSRAFDASQESGRATRNIGRSDRRGAADQHELPRIWATTRSDHFTCRHVNHINSTYYYLDTF